MKTLGDVSFTIRDAERPQLIYAVEELARHYAQKALTGLEVLERRVKARTDHTEDRPETMPSRSDADRLHVIVERVRSRVQLAKSTADAFAHPDDWDDDSHVLMRAMYAELDDAETMLKRLDDAIGWSDSEPDACDGDDEAAECDTETTAPAGAPA